MAAARGARLVCLQELTLSRYFAVDPAGPAAIGVEPEELPGGPTHEFAARLAAETGAHIHSSLYERADEGGGLGFNTAISDTARRAAEAETRRLEALVRTARKRKLYPQRA